MKFEDIESSSNPGKNNKDSSRDIYSSSDKSASSGIGGVNDKGVSVGNIYGNQNGTAPVKKRRKKEKFSFKRFILSYIATVLVLALLCVGAGLLYYNNILGTMIDDDDASSRTSILGEEDSVNPEYTPSFKVPDPSKYSGYERQLAQNAVNNSKSMRNDSKILNVLLLGCDSFDSEKGGRSDTTMIASINLRTKQIRLVSIMRDMYVYIPGKGFNKFNGAFSYGGADLTIDTVEANFGIKIDRYAQVNFDGFVDIIDTLGGLTIDIQSKEVSYVNDSVRDYNKEHKLSLNDGILKESGSVRCTGKQALGFARIRNISTATHTSNDFGRTERQRIVISELVDEMKGKNLFELKKVADKTSKYVKMNFSAGEVTSLLPKSLEIMKYPIEQGRVPQDNAYQSKSIQGCGDCLLMDIPKTMEYIQNEIYHG